MLNKLRFYNINLVVSRPVANFERDVWGGGLVLFLKIPKLTVLIFKKKPINMISLSLHAILLVFRSEPIHDLMAAPGPFQYLWVPLPLG